MHRWALGDQFVQRWMDRGSNYPEVQLSSNTGTACFSFIQCESSPQGASFWPLTLLHQIVQDLLVHGSGNWSLSLVPFNACVLIA